MEQDVLAPRIEGYRVHELLGRGGMGAVWRATDIATDRQVALKVLGLHTLGSRRARLRFEREVSLASRLEHPGIARVYGSGIGAGAHFYAMELIDGRPLDQYIRAEGLDASAVIELFLGVIDAVGHAHRRGVIHRDLKPGNVLVDADGQPHVLDFGLATAEDVAGVTVSGDGSPLGTLAYMAPEQARGQLDRIDLTSDLYSLGLMLCECLAGELPYKPWATRLELENRVTRHELRRPRAVAAGTGRSIGRDLEAILERCLAEQPERRYAAAEALAADLRAYRQGEPVSARPLTLTYVMSRRLRRHWKPVAAAAAVLALLLGTAVFSYLEIKQQRDIAIANEQQADAQRRRAERTLYLNQIAHAQGLIEAGRRRDAVAALEQCDPDYRQAEWAYLRQRADSSVWTQTFETAVEAYALTPAGDLLAMDQQGWLHRLGAEGRPITEPIRMPMQRIIRASFAEGGQRVIMSDFQRWTVWDTVHNEIVGGGILPESGISHSLDHRGQSVMLGGRSHNPQPTYRVNLADGTRHELLTASEQTRIPFATGEREGMLEKNAGRLLLFDRNGQTTHTISLPGTPTRAVAAHGEQLAVGLESGQVVLITPGNSQTPTVMSTRRLFPDQRPVRSLTFFHEWVFAGDDAGGVVAEPVAERRASVAFPGLEQRVIWLKVRNDRWLLAATADTVKAWDLLGSAWALTDALEIGRGSKSGVALFDRDRSIAAASYTGQIHAARLADAKPLWTAHVASITPLRLQADDAHGRLLVSGGMGWAILDAGTGRVLHRQITRRRTDVVCLNAGSWLVAAEGADAQVHTLADNPANDDGRPTVAIRRPLVRVEGRAGRQPIIIGTAPAAPDRLVAYPADGDTPPRELGRVDQPIDGLSRPSEGQLLVIADQGAWRLGLERGELEPLPDKAVHLSWQPDADRGLMIKADRACLVEKPGAQEILGLRLPPLHHACWLSQREAWLHVSPAGLGLIPATPAQDRRASRPFKYP